MLSHLVLLVLLLLACNLAIFLPLLVDILFKNVCVKELIWFHMHFWQHDACLVCEAYTHTHGHTYRYVYIRGNFIFLLWSYLYITIYIKNILTFNTFILLSGLLIFWYLEGTSECSLNTFFTYHFSLDVVCFFMYIHT